MGYVVRMPKLGLEMDRGTLIEWRIDAGESVNEGDVIADIESEKTSAEVDSREDGVLRKTYLEPGETVEPGDPIGIVATNDEDISELEAQIEATAAESAAATAAESTKSTESTATASADSRAAADLESVAQSETASVRARRGPEHGRRLRSTGSITEADVERTAESGGSEATTEPRPERNDERPSSTST